MYYYNENEIHVFEINKQYFLINSRNLNCCEVSNVIFRILNYANTINPNKIKIELKNEFSSEDIDESIKVLIQWKILKETSSEVIRIYDEYQNPYDGNNIWLSGLNLVI